MFDFGRELGKAVPRDGMTGGDTALLDLLDLRLLKAEAKAWSGLVGLDLAKVASSGQSSRWSEKPWVWNEGAEDLADADVKYHIVALDYGVKRNILRLFAGLGCKVTVMPATTSADEVLAQKPDGIFLSNGPGDPAATGEYAVPVIKTLIETGIPVFGI